MNTASVLSRDKAMAAVFKVSPEFAVECLNAALANDELPDGHATPLTVLRQIAMAQGLEAVAERAGMSQKRLCEALHRKGSPNVKTFVTILHGVGLRLKMSRSVQHVQDRQLATSSMFKPPHPGFTLSEDVLLALGLECLDAVKQLDISADTLNLILNGRAPIAPEVALRIEAWLGAANGAVARLWLAQQSAYDRWLAQQRCKTNAGQAQ
jgi:addiction module HigA family antidote